MTDGAAYGQFTVATWNTSRRGPSIVDALVRSGGRPDIVTLQEVTHDQAGAFRKTLAGMGLPHAIYTGDREAKDKRYGNVIASRWPARRVSSRFSRRELPWPQLIGHASLDMGRGEIDVITAHIPNGSGNGWTKIDTFRVLAEIVRGVKGRPCILTGDFNEPQYAIHNDRIVTFGQDRDIATGRYSYWRLWSFRGRSGTGEEWDRAVRWFFEPREDHGLRNAYWAACGRCKAEVSHRLRGRPRWFDHMFVSDHFHVKSCRYIHTVRLRRLSDHSALVTQLSARGNATLQRADARPAIRANAVSSRGMSGPAG